VHGTGRSQMSCPVRRADVRRTDPYAALVTMWRIRPAERDDVPAIHTLIEELALYEREPQAVEATPDDLAAALFAPDPRVHALVALVGEGEEVAGVAVWFVTYSTWRGRHGIWLEDLFVRPAHRRLGLGRALLAALAGACAERGYRRLEWAVLDWNEPAHAFYRELGALPQDDWTTWRLTGSALSELGGAGQV